MGALPRPDIPAGPQRELVDALHALHHRAGWPSLRVLAREIGCSHTTVSVAFSSPRIPSWGVLELLVEAMHGDVAHFHTLWLAATAPERTGAAPDLRIAGRSAELATVRSHVTHGAGRLLLVRGEAGIGKSHLVSTSAILVGDTAFVASGWCLPLSSEVPLLPVADVFRALHEVDDGGWVARALDDCPRYVGAALARLVPELELSDGGSRDARGDTARLFGAAASALSALARVRPLAVVLEDLHWADCATLDVLEYMVARRIGVPLLATWRTEEPDTPPATTEWCARMRRMPAVQTLELGPLNPRETVDHLALLGVRDPETVEQIQDRSRGQPLFTEQLAAQVDEDLPLPAVLGDLLDRRLTGLGESAWAIARALGVADRALNDHLLAGAAGIPLSDLPAGLHELAERRLLASATGREVGVRHPLLAEAIRRRLTAIELVDDHRRLAAVLGRAPEPSAAEVAEHWERAGDAGEELVWRIRAAQQAGDRYAFEQEADQWRRALAIWPPDLPQISGVRMLDAYLAAYDALAGIDLAAASEVAQQTMEALPDLAGLDAAEVYRRAAECQGELGDPQGGIDLVDRAIRIYESAPPSAGYVHALTLRDVLTWGLDRRDEGTAACALGTEISAGLDDVALYRQMLAIQAEHDAEAGQLATALERIETAMALRAVGPDPQVDVLIALLHTDILLVTGAAADDIVEAGRPGVEAVNDWGLDTAWTAILLANIGQGLRRAGRVEEAARLMDPVTEGPPSRDRWAVHAERARLDLLRGRYQDATDRIRQVSETYLVDVAARVDLMCGVAMIDLWCDRPDRAYEQATGSLREVGSVNDKATDIGGLLVLATRAAADRAAHGSDALRTTYLDEINDLLRRTTADPFAPHPTIAARPAVAATWTAEVARLARQPDLGRWSAAAEQWDRLARPHYAAYCRWRAAQAARATGRRTAATRILRRAVSEAQGHVPLLTAIGADLASFRRADAGSAPAPRRPD